MIRAHITARVPVRVTVEALAVPDHVKFHVGHRRQGAPESVVKEPELTLHDGGTMTVDFGNGTRAAHERSFG
jgi:hypothetical protein